MRVDVVYILISVVAFRDCVGLNGVSESVYQVKFALFLVARL